MIVRKWFIVPKGKENRNKSRGKISVGSFAHPSIASAMGRSAVHEQIASVLALSDSLAMKSNYDCTLHTSASHRCWSRVR